MASLSGTINSFKDPTTNKSKTRFSNLYPKKEVKLIFALEQTAWDNAVTFIAIKRIAREVQKETVALVMM